MCDEIVKEMVISKDRFGSQYVCDLTREMDSYLLSSGASRRVIHTYLSICSERVKLNGEYVKSFWIRLPGATRGILYFNDDNVIVDILFSEAVCYSELKAYRREMESIKHKYIGAKIIAV